MSGIESFPNRSSNKGGGGGITELAGILRDQGAVQEYILGVQSLPDDILQALGEIDESIVENAKNQLPHGYSTNIATLGLLSAFSTLRKNEKDNSRECNIIEFCLIFGSIGGGINSIAAILKTGMIGPDGDRETAKKFDKYTIAFAQQIIKLAENTLATKQVFPSRSVDDIFKDVKDDDRNTIEKLYKEQVIKIGEKVNQKENAKDAKDACIFTMKLTRLVAAKVILNNFQKHLNIIMKEFQKPNIDNSFLEKYDILKKKDHQGNVTYYSEWFTRNDMSNGIENIFFNHTIGKFTFKLPVITNIVALTSPTEDERKTQAYQSSIGLTKKLYLLDLCHQIISSSDAVQKIAMSVGDRVVDIPSPWERNSRMIGKYYEIDQDFRSSVFAFNTIIGSVTSEPYKYFRYKKSKGGNADQICAEYQVDFKNWNRNFSHDMEGLRKEVEKSQGEMMIQGLSKDFYEVQKFIIDMHAENLYIDIDVQREKGENVQQKQDFVDRELALQAEGLQKASDNQQQDDPARAFPKGQRGGLRKPVNQQTRQKFQEYSGFGQMGSSMQPGSFKGTETPFTDQFEDPSANDPYGPEDDFEDQDVRKFEMEQLALLQKQDQERRYKNFSQAIEKAYGKNSKTTKAILENFIKFANAPEIADDPVNKKARNTALAEAIKQKQKGVFVASIEPAQRFGLDCAVIVRAVDPKTVNEQSGFAVGGTIEALASQIKQFNTKTPFIFLSLGTVHVSRHDVVQKKLEMDE